jgi:hypothetical protein
VNERERFWRLMSFQPVDRIPLWADWLGPFNRWHGEGLPQAVNDREGAIAYFGFEGMFSAFWGEPRVPVKIGLYPGFQEETLEETGLYRVYRTGAGTVVKQFKEIPGSLKSTQWLEYPIKTRDDWVRLRDEQLDPDDPGRYPPPQEWAALKKGWCARDNVISIDGGSFYGYVRDWIGVENLSLILYDDPGLIHEMMDYLADFYLRVLHRAVEEVDIDFAMFWEDMCYKTGPLLSPAMFREFMLPGYKKVTAFLREHGVELSWVDCDGNIEALLPLWIEGGVRGHYPLEVASDMDAARLRRQYGREIVMWGNVDKRALTAGKAAIDAELQRLAPVVAEGGFIPLVDHGVPDDVPYEHYLYYLKRRKELTGWA